jgi:hypothetical protein
MTIEASMKVNTGPAFLTLFVGALQDGGRLQASGGAVRRYDRNVA